MKSGGYQFQGPFALKHIAQGKREQALFDVLEVLEVRGLAIPEAVRQRIASCEDIAELERWHRRAVIVKSASELFEEPPSGDAFLQTRWTPAPRPLYLPHHGPQLLPDGSRRPPRRPR